MPEDQVSTASSYPRIIEGLFLQRDAVTRHLNLPMLAERQAYLDALLASGQNHRYVYERAIFLKQVIRLMGPAERTQVYEKDILEGADRWANERASHSKSGRSRRHEYFTVAARSWFRFLGVYVPPSRPFCRFETMYKEFVIAMREDIGYLPASITAASVPTRSFLEWISLRREQLDAICLNDVDAFIIEGRAKGWSHRTVKSKCQALRTFFGYAERRGWSHHRLSKTIKASVSVIRPVSPYSPPWAQIRRLIDTLDGSKPSECRAKAILLLASVYGMRSCEIARLTLEDIDWYNQVLTIRRAKRGRIQQFPLQYEIGEAIIHYLQTVRPFSRLRNVFLSLSGPPRPLEHLSQSMWRLLRSGEFFDIPCGLHSLRHACATELLRQGTSLHAISDFLGHRDIRSVSIYAHCDLHSLRQVANFSLEEVL
jgi:integrase/recombinase XerD